MKRTIQLLTVVLLLQLGLALGLRLTADKAGAASAGGKLLSLDTDSIDGLELDNGKDGKILLRKVADSWTLPEHLDAPADARKIQRMLTTLQGIERTWPVANSEEAARRFKVADREYERRLQFKKGDQVQATLLLGTSPGFRKVHARVAGEPQTFDIPFSTYQASLKAEDWVDKATLQLQPEQISAIQLPDCRLVREDDRLKLADLAETERTDEEQARQLVDRLARLTIQDVYGKADHPLPAPAALSISLQLADGKERRYDFVEGKEAGQVLLKVSDQSHLYKVGTALLKSLRETTRAKLVMAKEPSVKTTEEKKASTITPPPPG